MSAFKTIRERLGMTQAALGEALGCTQGNISFYEKGQTVPPDTARSLIAIARQRGLPLTFDHVYGGAPVPDPVTPEHPAPTEFVVNPAEAQPEA